MKLVSYIIPRTVARFSTPYNHDVRVLEERGVYKLLVYGSRQSGEYIRELWQQAFMDFGIIPSPDVRNILVLGVAGGTVIHLLHAIYPEAEIDGVDIDEKMIAVGKKYFGLDSVEGLTLHVADAEKFVHSALKRKDTWDMIIVDLFIGASIPPFVGEEEFLRGVKKLISPRGSLVMNYLREYEYGKLSELLLEKLRTIFPAVRDSEIYFNRFFLCM